MFGGEGGEEDLPADRDRRLLLPQEQHLSQRSEAGKHPARRERKRKGMMKKLIVELWPIFSVTRFGDLLDFGQLFKAFGNN